MLFSEDMNIDLLLNQVNNDDNYLFTKKEGLEKGNMFKLEYIPYKDYKPSKLEATNNKSEIELKLYECYFAIIDLNLYLDLHPLDKKMYETYKNYVKSFEKYKDEYEDIYGPLEITCITSNNYDWIKSPWPWENTGGIKNV